MTTLSKHGSRCVVQKLGALQDSLLCERESCAVTLGAIVCMVLSFAHASRCAVYAQIRGVRKSALEQLEGQFEPKSDEKILARKQVNK